MDEIDAALDFRNVSIVANYIKDRTKNAQFIIISLRNDMFELSHRLIGIYKTSNQTRSEDLIIEVLNQELTPYLTCRYIYRQPFSSRAATDEYCHTITCIPLWIHVSGNFSVPALTCNCTTFVTECEQ
jgi:hypothetical protein